MNSVGVLCAVACLLAPICAIPPQDNKEHSNDDNSKWLIAHEPQDTAALDEISLEKLEKIPLEKGAALMQKWYHFAQMNSHLIPSFVPSPNDIPVFIIKGLHKKETSNLKDFVKMAQQDPCFGDEEVTVFITGLPSTIETVKQANSQLIEAYMERYNRNQQNSEDYKKYDADTNAGSFSEDTSGEWNKSNANSGILVVIDLGQLIERLEGLAILNVGETGAMIGKALVQLTDDCNLPQEIIHVVAQGVAAHVAGVAGDEYTRLTGHKLRRITALDPSKVLIKNPHVLIGLARGDAEFVDAIHTSAYGMGTLSRVGDIDFFPAGPCIGVPGSENVIEASMRATLYFAESLIPGNERNFPAVEANSLKQYKTKNGFGKRAYMGIATDYDLRGDYVLLVNENSPFGKGSLIEKHYHHRRHYPHGAWHQDKN